MNVVVSRHNGVVEWLHQRGIAGQVISHVSDVEQIRGKIVYGVLPLHLAAECEMVISVDLPGLSPEQRGKDLSPAEMDKAGAILSMYVVDKVG